MIPVPDPGNVPLSLYVHIPWCVRKCPYCDFNSHEQKQALPEQAYIDALLKDLRQQSDLACGREVRSVFIGGGTPSLFSGKAIARLLQGIRNELKLADNAEVTLEANPGAVDAGNFSAYREAGVNRLSLGAQSFNAAHLRALGRIHVPEQISQAVKIAEQAGFENINLDLMFGLPDQNIEQAMTDLQRAIGLRPQHLSWYQLTIEPNTRFYHQPPPVPEDDLLWDMQQQGQSLLAENSYQHYEISAYAKSGSQCVHNLNYWTFGDYLAIGAGAHGKITTRLGVKRFSRPRHPQDYLEYAGRNLEMTLLKRDDIRLEFMMNALRLQEGVSSQVFEQRTGLLIEDIANALSAAYQLELMRADETMLQPTLKGRTYLNDLLGLFD